MSSAAATRTSTGNITGLASRGTAARSSASTSSRDSRGTAYSDSTNRTRRGVTNTWCDVAEYERLESVAAASLLSGLISEGTARPVRHSAPNAAFSITSYSRNWRQPGMRGGVPGPESRSRILLLRLTRAFFPYGNQ
jgi:hypothetical protein